MIKIYHHISKLIWFINKFFGVNQILGKNIYTLSHFYDKFLGEVWDKYFRFVDQK